MSRYCFVYLICTTNRYISYLHLLHFAELLQTHNIHKQISTISGNIGNVTVTPFPPPLPVWVICNTSLPLDICTESTCSVLSIRCEQTFHVALLLPEWSVAAPRFISIATNVVPPSPLDTRLWTDTFIRAMLDIYANCFYT